jgi:hypothetical protein
VPPHIISRLVEADRRVPRRKGRSILRGVEDSDSGSKRGEDW